MLHLIQRHTFRDHHYQLFMDTVKRFDLPHQVVEIVPFTRELVYEDQSPIKVDTDNIFCWGSVRMAHIAKDYGWKPGSFHNENHDYRVYSEHYKDQLMNYDSRILKFGDSFVEPGYLFFARPCEDTKTFTGQVFTKASWDEFVAHSLTNGHTTTLCKDTAIQVCKIKDIQREIRVWVVKGRVITASQYKIGDRVIYERCNEPMIIDYAQSMVDIYQPADAFVIDVAMVADTMRIVEINCINCAGFYESDLQKLLLSVEDAFGK